MCAILTGSLLPIVKCEPSLIVQQNMVCQFSVPAAPTFNPFNP